MKDKIFILLLTLALPVSLAATESNYLIDYHSGHYYEAGKTLRKLAHKNDTQALYYLGKMYVKGYGVVHNMKHGNRLILKSAQLGYEPAQNYLAYSAFWLSFFAALLYHFIASVRCFAACGEAAPEVLINFS